jgi:hypothetical protein
MCHGMCALPWHTCSVWCYREGCLHAHTPACKMRHMQCVSLPGGVPMRHSHREGCLHAHTPLPVRYAIYRKETPGLTARERDGSVMGQAPALRIVRWTHTHTHTHLLVRYRSRGGVRVLGHTPPCKIRTIYAWRISQGGTPSMQITQHAYDMAYHTRAQVICASDTHRQPSQPAQLA